MDQIGSISISRRERLLAATHFHNAVGASKSLKATGGADNKLMAIKELEDTVKEEKTYRNLGKYHEWRVRQEIDEAALSLRPPRW